MRTRDQGDSALNRISLIAWLDKLDVRIDKLDSGIDKLGNAVDALAKRLGSS